MYIYAVISTECVWLLLNKQEGHSMVTRCCRSREAGIVSTIVEYVAILNLG